VVSVLTTFASGQRVHLDVAFAPERVAVECVDFPAGSAHRRRGRDRRRDHTATLASDWLVLTLTWDRFMHDWRGFVTELREALETRSPGTWGGGRPVRLVDTTRW
jgi:hypothetical protein